MQMIEAIPDIILYTNDSTTNWLFKVVVFITGTQRGFFSWLWKFCRSIVRPLLLTHQLANVPKKCLMNSKPEGACFACKAVVFGLSCQPAKMIRVRFTSFEQCCQWGLLGNTRHYMMERSLSDFISSCPSFPNIFPHVFPSRGMIPVQILSLTLLCPSASPADSPHSSSPTCHFPLVWTTEVIHLDDVSGFLNCLT